MYIIILEMEFDNEIFHFEKYDDAEFKYLELKNSGQYAHFTKKVK